MKVVRLTEKGKEAVIEFLSKHLKNEPYYDLLLFEVEETFIERANLGESFSFEVSQFYTKSNRPEIFIPDHDHIEIVEVEND